MKAIRIILICVILIVMGGIGLSQVDWSKVDLASTFSGGEAKPKIIKSTSTSRVGADKTIMIKQEKPGIWTQIMMFFGWEPKDPHMAQLDELKKQRAQRRGPDEGREPGDRSQGKHGQQKLWFQHESAVERDHQYR